jgi:hypothetical protein
MIWTDLVRPVGPLAHEDVDTRPRIGVPSQPQEVMSIVAERGALRAYDPGTTCRMNCDAALPLDVRHSMTYRKAVNSDRAITGRWRRLSVRRGQQTLAGTATPLSRRTS